MFCPFGGLAHDLGVWRRKNGEYQNPCCGPGIETSPNKIKPYFGKLWKTQWSLQSHGSWRPFWEGSGPFTKSRPSIFWVIHLSSMMKFPLHLWGSGYDSVSNCPYKIKGKNACFWGTTPWFCKGNCQGYYIYIYISVCECVCVCACVFVCNIWKSLKYSQIIVVWSLLHALSESLRAYLAKKAGSE